ncbi:helix-turn-helix transcriptional regulator [Enterococcus faecalis]|uniref:helix-turn-helix domain-containing protein n=1 Tax=Enterococcus TaxID=1350 RepID=UPI000CF268EA|nr:helix-turn-helix transcriptional regulator [Enterococcus faecalis]EGO8324864.1 helix-turn-helix transcriptional regulator [Enterococcus faecalis]EGO8326964.1 helix-turn-helix transcriptional regulator [Enterococcus faecalis]EHK9410338.1 helix-turn-helix transcriptional regulator [Enterococcus faecalis]EHK9412351.1 helix-turn-helix transcriptional regulator [Enterococcus faecalis]EHU9666315.1 helix-turn-helix transcriptional regulator [Enterococcus faecalis]
MFGLLQPNKEKVGARLKQIKDEMNISFTEFGNRLGLKKPTISSYVQGYNLAPIDVIEKIAKISGKSVGWFYFGDIEEYIADYLKLKGQADLIKAYPEVISQIKEEFFSGDFKNPGWENEVGYPVEEFIDDCFADILPDIMSRYVSDIVNEKIINSEKLSGLTEKEKEEAATIITSDTNDYIEMSGEIKYGEKEKIGKMVEDAIDNLERKGSIEFSEEYMIGKLINVLDDDKATEKLISGLSQVMTDKPFSTFFGGKELVEIFQTMRPALMKLYVEKSVDEVYEWFEK